MKNPRLSYRYAKSLVDISLEMNALDKTHDDILFLRRVMKSSREFVVMLNSPVIKSDKKFKILEAVAGERISKLTLTFLQLLTRKNREMYLDGIVHAFIQQYNRVKGIHTATLTTAVPVSAEIVNTFEKKLKAAYQFNELKLETAVNEDLIGGFVLEFEGKRVDASIRKDLKDVRKQFADNEYLHKLR